VSHLDRKLWVDSPSTRYKNMTATTCKVCGTLIGYRPMFEKGPGK